MGMKFKALSAFMPLDEMRKEAQAETAVLTERNDVPNGPGVPEDLRDRQGRFFGTREGYRISGRMLVGDMLDGSPSAALPLLYATYPFMAFALGFLSNVGILGSGGVLFFNLLWFFAVLQFGSGILRFIGLALVIILAQGGPDQIMAGLGSGLGSWFMSEDERALMQEMGMASGGGGGMMALIATLIPAVLPLFMARRAALARARALAAQGSLCALESMGEMTHQHEEPRRIQAEQAARDKSPFITLGEATGACTRKWDGFAPDAGLPVGLTTNDLSTHLVIFGKTGSGKTSRALRVIADQYGRSSDGGLLVLDGKGALPKDLKDAGLAGFRLVNPSDEVVSLTENLTPVGLADAVVEAAGSAGGENAFWTSSGHTMLLSAAQLLARVVELEKGLGTEEEARKYFWTLGCLKRLYSQMSSNPGLGQSLVDWVKDNSDEMDGPLGDACAYWSTKGQFHSMDEKTRSNVKATVDSWLSPVFAHPNLRKWAESESGVRVEDVLEGARMGFNVPIFMYKEAGLLVNSLIKGRVFHGVKMRGTYGARWQEELPKQKPLMLMVDECQEFLAGGGKSPEASMLPIARSIGLKAVYASQSVDAFIARMGEKEALALLDNFVSFMTFAASPTTLRWVVAQIGFSQQLVFDTPGMGVDYSFTASLASTSPLRDPSHPDARLMRGLRRTMDSGSIKTVEQAAFGKTVMQGLSSILGKGGGSSNADVFATATEVSPVLGGKFMVAPVMSEDALSARLSTPGAAFIQVSRAGVRRRDLCSTFFVEEWREKARRR